MRFKYFFVFFIIFSFSLFGRDNFISISGFVVDKEYRLGNAKISFFNSENKVYSTKTNINGNFTVTLPKNKYRVTVKKTGYSSLENTDLFVDYIFNNPEPLILNMVDNKILVSGRILNQNGNSIKNANIKVKIGENLENLKSDNNGFFSFQGKEGLISIFATKKGYYGNGTALLIEKEKYINDISIKLEEKTYFLSGTLSNEDSFLKNTEIEIINGLTNKKISKVRTNEYGIFEFRDIRYFKNVYFKVPIYKFRSESFTLNKDFRQYNIFTK
ncbi:carboxypeptidase-like regulatory domain-containing protein [uncultured Cetobacterium sp.]|uniref:carboxypeptidase-like regulatory domain-containing protein n=1 Tax=uncultured Cetobacterium sp. TaxID=527638 RepID=UPI0026080A68|nr:carboxypeptidase-like regulatory domain-containing protein [uncultured Cetobacterium sp.]